MLEPWVDLPKTQTDPTTIIEQIADDLAVHNADPNAHMDSLASLETHRTSQIVDHLAESVVNDKLKPTSRRYVAIVDPNDDTAFDTLQSAVDYAVTRGGGTILIVRGNYYIAADFTLPFNCNVEGLGIGQTFLLSNTTSSVINCGSFTLQSYTGSITSTSGTSGSSNISYAAITSSSFVALDIGTVIQVSGPSKFYRIIARPTSTTAVLDTTLTANMSGNLSTFLAIYLTNGSNIGTFDITGDIGNYGIYPGCTYAIKTMAFANVSDITASEINLDNELLLTVNWSGSTGWHVIYGNTSPPYTQSIANLTLGSSSAGVDIYGDDTSGSVNMDYVYQYAAATAFECYANDYFTNDVTNSTIILPSAGVGFSGSNFNVGDTWIGGTSGTIHLLGNNTNCTFENIVFQCSGTGTKISASPQTNIRIVNSKIYNFGTSTIGAASSGAFGDRTVFSQNFVQIRSSNTMDFGGYYNLINGNVFESSGSTGTRLISGSNKNIFTDNHTEIIVTNSGTNNTVADNIVGV